MDTDYNYLNYLYVAMGTNYSSHLPNMAESSTRKRVRSEQDDYSANSDSDNSSQWSSDSCDTSSDDGSLDVELDLGTARNTQVPGNAFFPGSTMTKTEFHLRVLSFG